MQDSLVPTVRQKIFRQIQQSPFFIKDAFNFLQFFHISSELVFCDNIACYSCHKFVCVNMVVPEDMEHYVFRQFVAQGKSLELSGFSIT